MYNTHDVIIINIFYNFIFLLKQAIADSLMIIYKLYLGLTYHIYIS